MEKSSSRSSHGSTTSSRFCANAFSSQRNCAGRSSGSNSHVRCGSGGWPGPRLFCAEFFHRLDLRILFSYTETTQTIAKQEGQLFLVWPEFSIARASHSQGVCG